MMTAAPQLSLSTRPQPDLRALFERQRAHAPAMARTTAKERVARLQQLRGAIIARRAAIAEAMRLDLGRNAAESELTEIHTAIAEIDHTCRHLAKWMRPKRVPQSLMVLGTSSRVHYEPLGVVLVMAPWNYPFILTIHPMISAVAAGNCAVLKPSEKTPHVSAVISALIADACDPGEVAVAEGAADTARALLDLPFDHFFFTGGPDIGKVVMAAAAKHLAGVTLELGGKSPVIIHPSADIGVTAERVVLGRFMNAGQTCVAPDYVFVHTSREAEFLAAARAAVERFYGADEAQRRASPDYGRIVDAGHFGRLKDVIEQSVAAGAKVETGGTSDAATRYIAPTILSNVQPTSPSMQQELFGPILPVMTWDAMDEVVRHIRANGKPLAMYIFTGDPSVADELVAATSSGMTSVNNIGMFYFSHDLPFGGVGASGMGNYHGEYGFRTLSHARPVLRQRGRSAINLFFPPYRGRAHAWGRKLLGILEWLRR